MRQFYSNFKIMCVNHLYILALDIDITVAKAKNKSVADNTLMPL